MKNKIESFEGEHSFLSNFYNSKLTIWGIEFLNSESAYQSAKLKDIKERKAFANLEPMASKKKARKIEIRKDWENVKESVMREVVKAKFSQNKELSQKLIQTGNLELIEGNYWKDTFWGVCDGIGQNKLGKILMEVRSTINK